MPFILAMIALLVITTGALNTWRSMLRDVPSAALHRLGSSDLVRYVRHPKGWLVYTSVRQVPGRGLVLLADAWTDPRYYAALAHDVAAFGHQVVVVPYPRQGLGIDPGLAREVVRSFPLVDVWAVGGHQEGAAAAVESQRQSRWFYGILALVEDRGAPGVAMPESGGRGLLAGSGEARFKALQDDWARALGPRTLVVLTHREKLRTVLEQAEAAGGDYRVLVEEIAEFLDRL